MCNACWVPPAMTFQYQYLDRLSNDLLAIWWSCTQHDDPLFDLQSLSCDYNFCLMCNTIMCQFIPLFGFLDLHHNH